MRFIFPAVLMLTACGEAVEDNHFSRDMQEPRTAAAPVETEAVPVRIGELGPSFPACNAAGVTRNLAAGETLPVRAAPFDTADEIAQVPAGSRFSICTRSHDQKWFGIVFAKEGESCGVSAPVSSRRNYDGPCGSGWVSSPFVKHTASLDEPQQADQ